MAKKRILKTAKGAFTYGHIAIEGQFTNRIAEKSRLKDLVKSGISTILISPRRWGKSSLIRQVALEMEETDSQTVFCFIDLFDVRNEQEFYESLAKEIIQKTSPKWKDKMSAVSRFLSNLVPQIGISPDPVQELTLSFNWQKLQQDASDVLNLADRIAEEKNIRIVVCIDEFQNIAHFDEPLEFQKRLRSYWQHHSHVSYCLYGSKRHMMLDVFTNASMPFYQFGELIFLEKISEADWIPFIQERFTLTGKSIEPDAAAKIAQLVENHPHYVQQLAQQVWFRSLPKATLETVETAFNELILQLNLFFQSIVDNLTNPQLRYLSALLDGVESMSSQETLKTYQLGTSANIVRIKQALIQKDVLDFLDESPLFIDPVFKAWLIRDFFKKNH